MGMIKKKSRVISLSTSDNQDIHILKSVFATPSDGFFSVLRLKMKTQEIMHD